VVGEHPISGYLMFTLSQNKNQDSDVHAYIFTMIKE